MAEGPTYVAKPTVRTDKEAVIQEFLALVQDLRQEQFYGASVDVDLNYLDWVEDNIQNAPGERAQLGVVFVALAELLPTIRTRIKPSLLRGVQAEIDFAQLTWKQFEQLCVDLLEAEGFINVIPGGGPGGDQGRDIAAEELIVSRTGKQSVFRWMVQCKHYASSGRSVGHRDVADIMDFLSTHDADGLLVITDTSLTAPLVKKLEEFDRDKKLPYKAFFWDGHHLKKLLLDRHPKLIFRYFPQYGHDQGVISKGGASPPLQPAPSH